MWAMHMGLHSLPFVWRFVTIFSEFPEVMCSFCAIKERFRILDQSISMIFSVVLNWYVLLTCWIVFHLESSISYTPIRLKMNQDLIAWRNMAGRNWITTILSHHEWCTWTTIINGQGIIAEKIGCFFLSFDNYKEL